MGPRLKSKLEEILQNIIPKHLIPFLPGGYAKIGHVLIITIQQLLKKYEKDVAEALLEIGSSSGVRTIAKKVGRTQGIHRKPQIKVIAGDRKTETIHKEHGTKFKLDPANITFSLGNHYERKRMIDLVSDNDNDDKGGEGEVIVDMFACVGNLSLPIAVHKKKVRIYAIEINPRAYDYLLENMKLNHVENKIIPILGDNRELTPENLADRVITGYLNTTTQQLEIAIRALKRTKGGWIHYHTATPLSRIKEPEKLVRETARRLDYHVDSSKTRQVKHYAPSIEHLTVDAKLSPS